jgi:alkyl sulfatase BDS1-like metallo-beta-lactamase superfamily hydrolase
MLLNKTPLRELVMSGEAKFEGEPRALGAVFTNLETFDPLFNIVTP